MTSLRYTASVWACLIFLLLLGCHLRIFRLDEFPPGISRDEAMNVVDGAYFSRSGRLPLFQNVQRPEPLNRIYGALTSYFFGDSIWAFRYTSALWGMLSLAAVFWASQQCFAEQPERVRRLIGLLALASLTAALGHIAISRSVYRAPPLVVFVALAAGFTCRALRRNCLRDYVFSGISLALGCYTYTAALALPLAFPPLALQLLVFHRRSWCRWLPGLAAIAIALFVLTLPISYLLLTQPEAILARAYDVADSGQVDWLERLSRMAAQFMIAGDKNPQYNVDEAALVPPAFALPFLAGLVTLCIRLRQPASTLLLSLLIASLLPALLTSVSHALCVHAVFALIPVIAGASVILPFKLLAPFNRLTRPLAMVSLAGLLALALYAAQDARRAYADYWGNANNYWRKWRIHDLDLSHDEWFFRADKRFLADWIVAQDGPFLIPISELDQPTLRALLMRDFPWVESAPAKFDLPPQTRVIVPWLLETGAYQEPTARLALLNDRTITVLPPLSVEARQLVFSNTEGALELAMPDSAFPVAARIQALPAGWAPDYLIAPESGKPLARFNSELELRAYHGPDAIDGAGEYEFALDWAVTRPVSHEYGAFLKLLAPEWNVVAGHDKHIWRWLFPTVVWPPDQVFSQLYTLAVDEPLSSGAYRLVAGAWYVNGPELPAESFVDHATGGIASIGWVKVAQEREPAIPAAGRALAIEFAGQFMLKHIFIDQGDGEVMVNLYWTALQDRPPTDATIFLHALNDQGGLAAQDDGRPWGGRYPTFIWDAGETVATRHRLAIARADDVNLFVGMYTQPEAKRLIARRDGERLADDVAELGKLSELLARQSP